MFPWKRRRLLDTNRRFLERRQIWSRSTSKRFGEENDSLGDIVEDKKTISPLDAAITSSLIRQTEKILSDLDEREERILRMRFGIDEKYDHTLEEIGKKFNVSRERIRQIKENALKKLRESRRAEKLKNFIER